MVTSSPKILEPNLTANKLIDNEFMKFTVQGERPLNRREGIVERTRGFFVDFFNFFIWQHIRERGSGRRKLGEATYKLQNHAHFGHVTSMHKTDNNTRSDVSGEFLQTTIKGEIIHKHLQKPSCINS